MATKNVGKTPAHGLNVLMVDDDEICLFIQRRVVEMSGKCNTVQNAANGKIALDLLKSAAADRRPLPDLILLDLQMPIMNGTEFLQAFRSLDFPGKDRIAIVLLTSSVWESDKEYALSLGASQYLTKPFTVDVFQTLLCSLSDEKTQAPAMPITFHRQENKNLRNRLL